MPSCPGHAVASRKVEISSHNGGHSRCAAAGTVLIRRSRRSVLSRIRRAWAGPSPGRSWRTLPRNVVPGILRPAKDAHHVLHMRRFEKLEAAVFHERDVAATELDFEQVGVMGSTHQDGLVVQGDPGLSVLQHPFYYMVGLRLLILRGHEDRLL